MASPPPPHTHRRSLSVLFSALSCAVEYSEDARLQLHSVSTPLPSLPLLVCDGKQYGDPLLSFSMTESASTFGGVMWSGPEGIKARGLHVGIVYWQRYDVVFNDIWRHAHTTTHTHTHTHTHSVPTSPAEKQWQCTSISLPHTAKKHGFPKICLTAPASNARTHTDRQRRTDRK